MKRLDGPVRKQMQGTIDKIISGDPGVWAQTHPLGMALKGWNATKASRGHRVVHQPNGQGGIHIGYVGLHEYDKAIQRLTSRDLPDLEYRHNPKVLGWQQMLSAHTADGQQVGRLRWADRDIPQQGVRAGEVVDVTVKPAHQRRGVATEMFRRAKEIDPRVQHSEAQTDSGQAWAEKTAGASGPDYDNLQFHVHTHDPEEHTLIASHPEHGPIGALHYGAPGFFLEDEITDLAVHPQHRRRGVARQLLTKARELRPNLVHSESRSDAGEAWAKSVDPEAPEVISGRMGSPEAVGEFKPDHYRRLLRNSKTAGANGDLPDLTFKHYAPGERALGYSTKLRKMLYSHDHHVEAYAEHPETGQPVMVGHAQYSLWDSAKRGQRASVGMMTTHPAWRRRGINSAVIDEIRRTHPDHRVGYDFLSPDGAAFVKGQTGRDVTPAVGPLESQAAVRNVSDTASDGDGITDGMMIALVPPASIVEDLVLDEGEAAEQLHVTLAYLGQTDEYSSEALADLHEVVAAWAQGQAPFTATIQGVGTFLPAEEDGQHVLWASVDAPGLHRLHAHLVDYLKRYGYNPREDHTYTPHITLAYNKHHWRFVPKVAREDFKVAEVWVCVGGRWESLPLG